MSELRLIEAIDDPNLLGAAFVPYPRQREILEAVGDGPRIHVLACGRRGGKSLVGAATAVWDACLRPDLARHLRKGERRYAVCVAVNLAQARLFVAAARSIVEASPMLASLVESANDDAIEFSTGCTIAAFPCTARGGRGWPISTLLLDEFAHHVDGEGNIASDAVWRALTPSCAQFQGEARIIVASTPYGAEGTFAELFARARDGELQGAVAHHATSAEMNPRLDADFLRDEFERDPDMYAGEYEARFIGSGGAFLSSDKINAACDGRDDELNPLEATEYIAGLDPGFHSDPFGLSIVGRDHLRPERLRLALARQWEPTSGGSFDDRRDVVDATLADVVEICKHYGVRRAVCDQHLAPAISDYMGRRGIHVETIAMTAVTKTLAYMELRERLNLQQLDLYEHAALKAQLRRLRTRYKAGAASVVNPRVGGSHGDLAQSLAISVFAMRGSGNASLAASSGYELSESGLDDLYPSSGGLDYSMGF